MNNYKPMPLPPPGLNKTPTPKSSPGFWYDGNLVRWVNGFARPVKGWERLSLAPTASTIREVHRWRALDGVEWVAFLCDGHLYAMDASGIYDISPVVPIVPPGDDVLAGGYGMDDYNEGDYNTPREPRSRVGSIGPVFTLSNWGSTLLAMSSVDGRLLQWDPATPNTKAAAVLNAPSGRTFVVTPERFVLIFGANQEFNTFRWCDQEDITNWNMASTESKAGEFQVNPAAPIISATYTSTGVLFSTTIGWYLIRYVGLPYIYSYDPVFEGAVPLSAAGVVPFAEGAAWVAESDFFFFNGVEVRPLECDLKNFFYDNYDPDFVRYRLFGVRIDSTNEIWWFYPKKGSKENTDAVFMNFQERWWSKAAVARSAGENSAYVASPLLCRDTTIFKHESGGNYGSSELPWIETGPMGGSGMSMLRRILVDVREDATAVTVTTLCQDFNRQDSLRSTQPQVPDEKGVVRPHLSGRDFRIRLASAANGSNLWTFGVFMVDFVARGSRSGQI